MLTSFRPPAPSLRVRFLALAFAVLGALPSLHAHRAFEITSVGRLQHGRLELTVTLSLVMANYLLRDSLSPEAPSIDAENFAAHREALLRLAPDFFTVNDGPATLSPEKILLSLNNSGEPEFHFVYPAPATGSLRVSAPGLRAPAADGTHLVRVFDDDEKLLGAGLVGAPPAAPELSVSLAPAAPASVSAP
jgi:hypothetical protein